MKTPFCNVTGSLYKFIWVRHGTLDVEVDHVVMHLEKEEMISLTPLHHVQIRGVDGEYLTFLFNSNFYCIYGHDSEVSCNGFLFNGSSCHAFEAFAFPVGPS